MWIKFLFSKFCNENIGYITWNEILGNTERFRYQKVVMNVK